MKHIVKNFTLANELEIDSRRHDELALVHVICREGSMYFQHDMTPEQARDMADYLILSAIEAEEMINAAAIGCEVTE